MNLLFPEQHAQTGVLTAVPGKLAVFTQNTRKSCEVKHHVSRAMEKGKAPCGGHVGG